MARLARCRPRPDPTRQRQTDDGLRRALVAKSGTLGTLQRRHVVQQPRRRHVEVFDHNRDRRCLRSFLRWPLRSCMCPLPLGSQIHTPGLEIAPPLHVTDNLGPFSTVSARALRLLRKLQDASGQGLFDGVSCRCAGVGGRGLSDDSDGHRLQPSETSKRQRSEIEALRTLLDSPRGRRLSPGTPKARDCGSSRNVLRAP